MKLINLNKLSKYISKYYIYHIMLYNIIVNMYQYLLVKLFPHHFEYKNIERTNSSGSFIEYSDTDYD